MPINTQLSTAAKTLTFSPSHPTPPRWEIHRLDLSQGLPDLPSAIHAQGLYVVLWWHHIPLGHLEVPVWQLPLTAAHWLPLVLPVITATIGSHLLQQGFQAPLPGVKQVTSPPDFQALLFLQNPLQLLLKRRQEAAISAQETVSVVICTRDRPQQLTRCLQSLKALTTPAYEIIVIDNAPSSEATQQLVAEFPGVHYCQEPRPGLSVARNRGIAIATGDLIAFTDDDVEVHPHWLEQLRTAFQHSSVMAMTGLILPARLETEAEEVFQRGSSGFGWGYRPLTFDGFFFEKKKPYGVPVWRIGAGANMAFRRKVFDQLGGFDERLGAGASGCSEDSEFWYRILAAGWTCQYQPTAVVSHYHRADFSSLSQQMTAYMRGHVTALLIQAARHHHWGNLYRILVSLPKYYVKQIILGFLHGFQGRYRTVFTEIGGCLSGIVYYFRHRSDPPFTLEKQQPQLKTTQVSASLHQF